MPSADGYVLSLQLLLRWLSSIYTVEAFDMGLDLENMYVPRYLFNFIVPPNIDVVFSETDDPDKEVLQSLVAKQADMIAVGQKIITLPVFCDRTILWS